MAIRKALIPLAQAVRPPRRAFACIAQQTQRPRTPTHCSARRRTQTRDASTFSNYFAELKQAGRSTYKSAPIIFPVGLLLVLGSLGSLCYVTYLTAKVQIEMANYPESVGTKLRRARYFTDHDPDAAQAMKAYLAAIHLAREENMAALSDEVLGIWVDMARMLEKNDSIPDSIVVLDNCRKDCLKWVEENGNAEGMHVHRTRLLQHAIEYSHKIGELYSNKYHPNLAKAEEYLTWAVETSLKENARREKEGLKPGEGEYFTRDQQGAQLEALGHHFEERDNHYYASQLFLQALMIKPTQDCHSVVLMNNLAASISQQAPPPEPGMAPPSPKQLRESGEAWAKRALEVASKMKPPERTGECDEGCAVATHNLGEFAEMAGNLREARERYEEAHSLAHAIGFGEGMAAAEEGLTRISGTRARKSAPPARQETPPKNKWAALW
ncbi:hypothetical protein FH972_026471 [Carpinus fangiana]|uniref:MalT-like TPR region domain-containing protein n=1 Tax=Carpinus fangiana TaxID=176857 RepID=A0A5N6L4F5_9ROSI|nr:hypothetical protein FH972_026471 [Carpinus fangiana]